MDIQLMAGESPAWDHWRQEWQSGVNRLHFALRNFLSWTPGHYRETPAGPSCWQGFDPKDMAQAQALLSRYSLDTLPNRAARARVLETLTYLDWLDRMSQTCPGWFAALAQHSESPEYTFRWLDVGAKNWAYGEALSSFITQRIGLDFHLDGLELDPHRRYINGHTRGQAARKFMAAVPQAAYHEGDIRHWRQSTTVASLFLPFVFEEPHLAWGLPLDYFDPPAMLAHVLALLQPGGLLIIVNQGEAEAEAQERLLRQAQNTCPLEIQALGPLAAPFMQYRYPRFGWVCRKISP